MIKNLISAVQFTTILPTFTRSVFEPRGMIPCFPLVGLLLGAMLAGFDRMAMALWPAHVASLMDVVFMVAVTGAFHLDGLGDAADGLLGHRPREKALLIMKDSRIGVMGLAAIGCGLAIKWGGIASLTDHRSLLLFIVPAYARASMLFGIRFLDYGRPEGGTGHPLFGFSLRNRDFLVLSIPVFLSLFLGFKMALLLNIAFVAVVSSTLFYYRKRMGCITGDMLGAITEICEASLFLMISAGGI